jgi:hypothetical protein
MPREQLLGLAADVDRLLAAGATAAAGHDGLSRRGRALRELGQKVAALVPVADAVERVTSSSSREVGRAFLDLVVMARQLRGSLAATGPDGALQTIEASGPWQTPTPTRDVYNAHEALTGDASSSALEDAAERQVTGDLRLVPSALAALESNKTSIADVVAEKVLPAVGRGVLPDLLAKLDLKGKSADARRLLAVCKIDPKIGADLCRKGLNEGSPALKIQALECLPDVGEPGEAEKIALKLWNEEKKKDVKAAALRALRKATGDEALEVLMQAMLTGDHQLIVPAMNSLQEVPHPKATERLLRQVEERNSNLPPPVSKPKKAAKKPARQSAEKADEERGKAVEHLRRFVHVFSHREDCQPARILKTLLELAHHAEAVIRHEVMLNLGMLGPQLQEVVSALTEGVRDADNGVALAAVGALEEIPPEKREASIPVLLERAADPKADEDIVCGIVGMLPKHLNRFGGKIIALLRQLLQGKNDYVRGSTLNALAEIGPPARSLLPEILEHMKADRGGLDCDKVFVNIEPEGTASIPALIELLGNKKSRIRAYALEGLTGYGPKAQAAEPLVSKLLKDRDWFVKYNAERALAAIKGES